MSDASPSATKHTPDRSDVDQGNETLAYATRAAHGGVRCERFVRWYSRVVLVPGWICGICALVFGLVVLPLRLDGRSSYPWTDAVGVLAWAGLVFCPVAFIQQRAWRSRSKGSGWLAVVVSSLAGGLVTFAAGAATVVDLISPRRIDVSGLLVQVAFLPIGALLLLGAYKTAQWSASLPRRLS